MLTKFESWFFFFILRLLKLIGHIEVTIDAMNTLCNSLKTILAQEKKTTLTLCFLIFVLKLFET